MNYLTIADVVKAEFTEKKSRFVCILAPVQDVNDMENARQPLHFKYPGASHYCYAYIIREGKLLLEKSSDDGEPSGTAGRPMLDVLKNRGLQNVLAVVVRYFGGTLLGTGGLLKAYTRAVQLALDQSRLISMEYSRKLVITLEYSYYGSFQKQCEGLINQVGNTEFTDRVRIEIWISLADVPSFVAKINNLTGGTAAIELQQKAFFPKPFDILP